MNNTKRIFHVLSHFLLIPAVCFSQITNEDEVDYLRSSLYLDLIHWNENTKNEVSWVLANMPFPNKYNNHKMNRDKGSGILDLFQTHSQIHVKPDYDSFFQNYIDESNLVKRLIENWFSRKQDGTFDMSLVAERGFYNASLLESVLADNSIRGRAILADAGENLIQNTFVLLAILDIEENNKKFVISSEVRLFKLNWDSKKAQLFYDNYWIPRGQFSLSKRNAFETLDEFKLDLVGAQSNKDIIKTSKYESIINLDFSRFQELVVRHFDQVYANLQKEHEVFRVVTPLTSVEPLTAQIGMKEGLEGGEKFEVLEQIIDEETGFIKLKRKGVIKVKSGKVWDNRYNAGEEGTQSKTGTTEFVGKGNFYPGMLIRQIN